jgi:hypothetical protein
MDIRRDHRVLTQKTFFIAVQTINRARRFPGQHSTPGAALTYRDMDAADVCTMQTIMGQDIKMLLSGVKLKYTGAFSAT